MTIKLTGNTLGGTIEANGTPVANVTSAQGFPFCKNKLFNGEVTRINQRGFDGNWVALPWYPNGSIASNEASYGYDMWCKMNDTIMGQFIEAGNFRPSTVHTLSGFGVTTQQITSPASGNWLIAVPQAARNVQVEEGVEATPFEIRPISFELAQCQRYYERSTWAWTTFAGAPFQGSYITWMTEKRTVPSVLLRDQVGNSGAITVDATNNIPGSSSSQTVVGAGIRFNNWTGAYLSGFAITNVLASAVI